MMRETYEAINAFHYSGLKVFAKCPRLYFEKYIEKSYVEPDHDYFIYGHLVDCLVTQPETLDDRFVKVSRRVDGSTLDLEVKCHTLENEINEKQALAAAGNKTAIKGIESRQKKLVELRQQIEEAKAFGDKMQVPASIWDNAHVTAEEIKKLPLHNELIEKGFTCAAQQVLSGEERVNRKCMIDRLYVKDKQAVIVDIKTTYRLTDLDPLIYAGQLAYYKYIVQENGYEVLDCYALVGDKGERSLAQDFRYANGTLESALSEIIKTEAILTDALTKNEWPSAKSFRGREQECFTCSECSVRPFSKENESVTV